MPWSEWVQSPDYFTGTIRHLYEETFGALTFIGITLDGGGDSTGVRSQWPAGLSDDRGYDRHVQFRRVADSVWVDERDWHPPELDTLTLGVDYVQRPDRDVGDPDRFIEYESDGPNVFTGWDMTGRPGYTYRHPTMANNATIIPAGEFEQPTGFSLYFADGSDLPTTGTIPPMPGGVLFASGSTDDPLGTTYPDVPTPSQDSFMVLIRRAEPTNNAAAGIALPAPAMLYRMPRWRYWSPAVHRLRQVHRDDGLGVTPRRARGASSRATTNRALAYD